MKNSRYPTRIQLTEVSENGDEFEYSRQSGELNESLKDLIGNRDYQARVFLKPMGNAYEITCDFSTSMGLPCSRCGRPTEKAVADTSHEILVIEGGRPRNAKNSPSSQEGGEQSSGPFCNYLPTTNFNIAEFIHEQVASNEPYIVECDRPDCAEVLESLKPESPSDTHRPFSVLKDLLP